MCFLCDHFPSFRKQRKAGFFVIYLDDHFAVINHLLSAFLLHQTTSKIHFWKQARRSGFYENYKCCDNVQDLFVKRYKGFVFLEINL